MNKNKPVILKNPISDEAIQEYINHTKESEKEILALAHKAYESTKRNIKSEAGYVKLEKTYSELVKEIKKNAELLIAKDELFLIMRRNIEEFKQFCEEN